MWRSLEPKQAWAAVEHGELRLLDLRTAAERRRYGAPPSAIAVSLARHSLTPEGADAVYLCQHAVRSKLTGRRGAAEVAGGFVAWQQAGLPVEKIRERKEPR
ncbi:MAG TPA: rhodanese-like domain-containing protein [Gaiellaceae bacterium]|jgi:rhodanese-related sulfurtransferase